MKQVGGIDQMNRGKLVLQEIEGLRNKEAAEKVAQNFAAVSQEYSMLAFLPAGRPTIRVRQLEGSGEI